MYIDEARGNNLVARINDRIGLYAGKVTKRDNTITLKGDIRFSCSRAGTIDNFAARDQQITTF